MARFELTPAAELDLLHIACFGMERSGLAQSELYRDKLYQRFQALTEAPLHYPAVDYIRQGYRYPPGLSPERMRFALDLLPRPLGVCGDYARYWARGFLRKL